MQNEIGGDVYSGIARASGLLWCGRERAEPGRTTDTVLVYCHPSANFVGHYALTPTAALGVDAVGAVTRYAGNDTQVILENCVADLGSLISHLRDNEGYRRVVLVGNSGGGGLAAFYQSQAEKPTITDAPAGGGTDLTTVVLPPVDDCVMLNAHAGRAELLQEWLDPAIIDENDPFHRDPELDLFTDRALPLDRGWVATYRQAQATRMDRTQHGQKISSVNSTTATATPCPTCPSASTAPAPTRGSSTPPSTPPTANPEHSGENPKSANLRPVTLGSVSSLRSWLSQWSVTDTNGHGPTCLDHVSVPVFVAYATADKGCFPSMAAALHDAVRHPHKRLRAAPGAGHYFEGPQHLLTDTLMAVVDWLR